MLTYDWYRERIPEGPGNLSPAAVTHTRWQYRAATIDWNLDVIRTMTETEVESLVVHEFAHVLLDGLMSKTDGKHRELMEYTTEGVARALMYARDANKMDPITDEY